MANILLSTNERVVRADAIISIYVDDEKNNLSLWLCGGQTLECHYDTHTDLIDAYNTVKKAMEES